MRKHNFTEDEKMHIIQFLLEGSKNGKPARGKMTQAVLRWDSSSRSISRLWAAAKTQKNQGEVISLPNKKLHPKRVKKLFPEYAKIKTLKLRQRNTIRRLAKSLGVSHATVFRWIKLGLLKAHTSALKPFLTPANKLKRLRFCLDSVMYDRVKNEMRFRDMQNIIHIDEKWFFITQKNKRMILCPEEIGPYRTCKSKAFIPKIMFMCAVARPIFARDGSCIFDGKIGIFPFTQKVQAKRDSVNRKRGTWTTQPIDSVNKDAVRRCMLEQILPAIKAKCPSHLSKTIWIQQDNARPHITDQDPEFRAAASGDGFNIHLMNQPPNSPDMNANHLGFFVSIQSLQQEFACINADDLVDAVQKSFQEYEPKTLNKVFLSLQQQYLEILKVNGSNCYKQPHMGKDRMIRAGVLPQNLQVNLDVVTFAILTFV